MSNINRVRGVKEAPISWKERDLLTAAEKYMEDVINKNKLLINFYYKVYKQFSMDITQILFLKKTHFENAKRLLMDLPITPLQS